MIINEKRNCKQIPRRDKDGRIEYYIIPNYTVQQKLIKASEQKFLRILIEVVQKINKENIYPEQYIQISTQVALNRIIEINNRRNKDLYEEIKNKSIDFVLYDLNSGKILICIELDGEEHQLLPERKERDNLLDKMLKDVINLIHITKQEEYNKEEIYQQIINLKEIKEQE